jgi:hypothetical protein
MIFARRTSCLFDLEDNFLRAMTNLLDLGMIKEWAIL